MSGGENVSMASQDLQLVKNGVERCLQHYMHKKEAMNTLAVNDNIDPGLTELIWHRLEAENPEFFKAYYLKLLVKDQILEFNRLLSEQVELMRRTGIGGGIAPVLTSNGSQISPLQHIPTSCTAQNSRILKTESIMQQQQQQANMFVNCASTVHPSTTVQATVDGSISPSLFLPHNPNVGLGQASNGNIPRTEANYGASSHFNFSPPGNFVEARPLVGDACMSSFNGGADSINMHHHHHLNDTFLDGDGSSFGFLAQMPQSLGFPELAVADFPDSSDLLGSSYSRPHFMAPEANTFIDPPDIETLDPESGSLRYQSFGGPST